MADRVAVFNEGRIVQVGTPQDIYERPRTRFVADFVGSANVLPPDAEPRRGRRRPTGPACGPRRSRWRRADTARVTGTVTGTRYLGAVNRVSVRRRRRGDAGGHVPAGRGAAAGSGRDVGLTWADGAAAPDGRRVMQAAARQPCAALSDLFWRRPRLLLVAAAGAAAAVAGRDLRRLAGGAPGAELFLDRRILGADQPRVHAQDLCANCCARPISTSSCAPR